MNRKQKEKQKVPTSNNVQIQEHGSDNNTDLNQSYGRMFQRLIQTTKQINQVPNQQRRQIQNNPSIQNLNIDLEKRSTNQSENFDEVFENLTFDTKLIKQYHSQIKQMQIKIFGRLLSKNEEILLRNIQFKNINKKQQINNSNLHKNKKKLKRPHKQSFQMQFQKSTFPMASIFKKQQIQDKVFVNSWLDKQLDLLSKKLKNLWKGTAKFHPIILVKVQDLPEYSEQYYTEEYDLSNKKFLFTRKQIDQLIKFQK